MIDSRGLNLPSGLCAGPLLIAIAASSVRRRIRIHSADNLAAPEHGGSEVRVVDLPKRLQPGRSAIVPGHGAVRPVQLDTPAKTGMDPLNLSRQFRQRFPNLLKSGSRGNTRENRIQTF